MYVIAVYDVGSKRCGKMLKLCRRYLHWIQNSVFEGELTEIRLKTMIKEAEDIIDKRTDSLIIFKNPRQSWMNKEVIGAERSSIDQFL